MRLPHHSALPWRGPRHELLLLALVAVAALAVVLPSDAQDASSEFAHWLEVTVYGSACLGRTGGVAVVAGAAWRRSCSRCRSRTDYADPVRNCLVTPFTWSQPHDVDETVSRRSQTSVPVGVRR